MYLRIWYGVALLATLMTVLYLLLPERQVTLTSGIAGFAWAFAAIRGGSLTILNQDGTETAATTTDALQLLTGVLALVSFIVWILYRYGEYPPDPPGQTSST